MTTAYLAALIVGLLACFTDVRTRRIPNVLTFGSAIVGVSFHSFAAQGNGLSFAGIGWFVGMGMFFFPFALGGLGGGDVKLLAALGAWIGPREVAWTGLYAGIAGGVLALMVGLAHGYLRKAFSNVWLLLAHWRVMGIRPLHEVSLSGSPGPRLAYAIPIFVGVVIALWRH